MKRHNGYIAIAMCDLCNKVDDKLGQYEKTVYLLYAEKQQQDDSRLAQFTHFSSLLHEQKG